MSAGIIWIGLFLSNPASAQHSILSQIMDTQESMVDIIAENIQVGASYIAGPVLDPRSGRVGVLRNIQQASYRRAGAGMIIHPSGIIVTNAHTVNRANRITVRLHNNLETPAEVIRLINNIDMAFLRIQAPFPLTPVPLADSNQIHLGDQVLTIGSSPLLKQTVSGGVIIGLGRTRTATQHGPIRNDLFQTTINLYEGDSGGPLFNNEGNLIGLMTAKETGADHSSFAIPSNQILGHLIKYLKETNAKK
ncbi:MAG: trypsin-like peptidase domain-containing protein [Candidatus Omnitrophota bacterium]|jgi:S1-C subfamily serine protease